MDPSRPSAVESASDVSAALAPRTAEISADVYQLIVRDIPQLRDDKRVLTLLEASVGENVATILHVIQHGIDLDKVHAPAAAEEYARRLAQRGVPIAALLRAYRIGSARFQDWCLQELGRRTDNAAIISAAGMRIAAVTASYIDKVSEELVTAHELERENWLRNLSVARAARVRALIRDEQVDVASSGEPALGVPGFRRTHQQALSAQAVALAAGPSGQPVTCFGDVAPLALAQGRGEPAAIHRQRSPEHRTGPAGQPVAGRGGAAAR